MTDVRGEVEIPADPQRIVDLSGNSDILSILGYSVVGTANSDAYDYTKFPTYLEDTLQGAEILGYSMQDTMDIEAVMNLAPDLIIISTVQEKMYDQLSEIAPTVMIQLEALNWKEDIRTLAQVFGREDAADQWISAYEEKAKEAGEAVRAAYGEDTSYLSFLASGGQFFVFTGAGFGSVLYEDMELAKPEGLPEQSEEKWEESLRTIAELSPEHISAYSLIVEPGTPFAEQKLDLPDEDTEREMYARTAEILAEYGFFQYEISNYAKPGFACRHNIGYWKRTDYLGFGPSAASLFGNRRWTNTADRSLYLKACGALEKIREDEEILSRQDAMEEFMFLGLRMTQGISTAEFEEKFGKEIHAVYGGVLKKYEAMHLLQEHSGRLALTRDGISVSNVILADFLL